MQPECAVSPPYFRLIPRCFGSKMPTVRACVIVCAILALLPACRQPPNLVDPEVVQPYQGVRLKLAIGNGISQPHLVRQVIREWSALTGAEVDLLPGTWNGTDSVDFAILSAVDLPKAILDNRVVPLPDSYRSSRSTYKWNDLIPSVSDRVASWNTRAYGLPLFNEGRLLVYRTDRWNEFTAATKRDREYPETWEELCDFAEFFNKPNWGPSLPPHSKRSDELVHEFHRIAANYDRVAVGEAKLGTGPKTPEQREAFFSFDFSTQTGEPRIDSPAFIHAAGLMKRMQACRPTNPTDDPFSAFRDGKAVAAIATLDLLDQLDQPGVAAGWFGIAPLPGSRLAFENGAAVPLDSVNYIPYLGEGLWLGVVTPNCKHAEAAWDLFEEFGHPNFSLDVISAGKWGASGFRGSHFDSGNRNHWFGYGLDAPRTERLIDIQRQNAAISVANPTLVLRLPNREQYLSILRVELDRILRGQAEPGVGLETVAKRWREMKPNPETYRISLGL